MATYKGNYNMANFYQINPELDVPIYQQLVDSIRASVQRGEVSPKEKLPTVQQLSEELGVARGTIKRAYDELERLGLVEKLQGSGTFVKYRPEDSASSKEQAMAAIDKMFKTLEEMGFSPMEINIFLNLKMREREQEELQVKIALVECNPENLSHMAEQLRRVPHVDLYTYLVESLEEYPYKIGEDVDLIVTTAAHAKFLEDVLPTKRRIARVALRLTPHGLSQVIKLRKGRKVGVLGYSMRFAQLLHSTCLQYNDGVELSDPVAFSPEFDLAEFLSRHEVVLVPQFYERYCSAEEASLIEHFSGRAIECAYEMDEGSFLYLQEKTKRLLAEKTG